MSEKLWEPNQEKITNSAMAKFMNIAGDKAQQNFSNYSELYQWSVEQNEEFWKLLAEYFPIEFDGDKGKVCEKQSFLEYPWFPQAKLNFSKNLLRFKNSDRVALNGQHETGTLQKVTYKELYQKVARMQSFLKQYIKPGDVVACYMPNIVETVVTMLATTGLGGIFTSTSCDFGEQGVLDRFGQTEPKILVTVYGYAYNGKYIDLQDRVAKIQAGIPSIQQTVLVDFLGRGENCRLDKSVDYYTIEQNEASEVHFEPMPFNAPVYIMYSSGTTGKPKCIVHSAGGTLLQHVKELGLHCDLQETDNIMYFTTCGWMMWNWLVSSLFFGATITLYEGSPGYPSLIDFIQLIDREKINIFGTSPKFLRALQDQVGVELGSDFPFLKTMLSTGAPLLPDQFDYVYQAFKQDLLLGSICGGTDIIGCFMLGNPLLPVRRGEIQAPGLGMKINAYDEHGKAVRNLEGELVCEKPFISQPVGFWRDGNHEKFKAAYFSVYENIWHHGDFITITDDLGVVVHGRSDATLNPGGVRIGTAEIYRQTEKLAFIEDSVCVGRQIDGDVEVVLLVKMMPGEELSQDRINEIKQQIKQGTTPRHVPKYVKLVDGIPYTRSGKKMEVAVTRLVNGKQLTNIEAVANPESLAQYEKIQFS